MSDQEIPPPRTNVRSDLDKSYFDFVDCYESACDNWIDKIDNVKTDYSDPDKNVASFKKKMEICREFENFCNSHGPGGTAYFKEENLYEKIQRELDNYMKYEYEEAKILFEEEKEIQKDIRNISKKIMKEIQDSGGSIRQTELRKKFPKEDPDCYCFNQAIKSLSDSGKIVRCKEGKYIVFKTK